MSDRQIFEITNVLDNNNVHDAERMVRSFYRTIEPYKKRDWRNPRRISWEIFAEKGRVGFYVNLPSNISRLVKSRILDAYPSADIQQLDYDYVDTFNDPFVAEMELNKHHMFSTKITEEDTPLNSILNSMTRLEDDERMLLQITLLPINNTWQGRAYEKYRKMLFDGLKPKKPRSFTVKSGILYSIDGLFKLIELAISMIIPIEGEQKNTPIEREELKSTQYKIAKPAFNTNIRMSVESKDKGISSSRLSELANSFIELDGDNEWRRIRARGKNTMRFIKERKVDIITNNIATTSELASIIRLPNKNMNVPELKKALKTLPIPEKLDNGLFLANGLHNSQEIPVHIDPNRVDDLVHPMMVTGAMGGGKTTLIQNMMLERAMAGYSTILLDTQGDMSQDFLGQLPESEHHRVVWLDFGDLNNPVPLDLMEFVSLGQSSQKVDEMFVKDIAKNELIAIFKKMWGANFGPQTEYITRNNITAQIETGGTFMEMFRMLVDDSFREEITMRIRNKSPFAYSFWRNFQDNFSLPQKMRMVMPSINKIGTFVESPMISNIVSQGSQNFNFRDMMDEGKIVVITIPKGVLVGAWQLIASLIISKVWLAALSRSNLPISQRKPAFIASDEADDIINDNFPIMLSQSRKYRLGIILGFQYLDQIKDNNKKVYNALMGNKPAVVALKIGEKDLEKVYKGMFKDYYSEDELRGFPDLHGVAQLPVNGKPTSPFTIRIPYNWKTRDNSPRDKNEEGIAQLKDMSRKLYARPLHEVEEIVRNRYEEALSMMELGEEEDIDYDTEASEDLLQQLRSMG